MSEPAPKTLKDISTIRADAEKANKKRVGELVKARSDVQDKLQEFVALRDSLQQQIDVLLLTNKTQDEELGLILFGPPGVDGVAYYDQHSWDETLIVITRKNGMIMTEEKKVIGG